MKRDRNDAGTAAVEFALVLPILVMLLFGIISLGRAYMVAIEVTDAARQGARASAVDDSSAAAIAGYSGISIVSDTGPGAPIGSMISVTAQGSVPVNIPGVINTTLTIQRTANMRKEGP